MAKKKVEPNKAVEQLIPVAGQMDITDFEERSSGSIGKFFSANDSQREQPEQVSPVTLSGKKQPAKKTVVFSFRADPDRSKAWKIYAQTAGLKMEELGNAAMEEYIRNHALDGTLRTAYELRVAASKEDK